MTDDAVDGARSIDTVIRGFTDAELALREVVGAVERIRSASEQLDDSRADQVAAREALADTAAAIHALGAKVEAVAAALHENTTTLSGLDPERLWRHLDNHAASLQAASDRSVETTGESTERVMAELDRQARSGRRLTILVSVALAASVASVTMLLALALGLLTLA